MTNENGPKYPLANDPNGNPIDVPEEAVAWRVRRLAKKAGRPKAIFDPESGRPLELPLTSTIDDLAAHVGESGRYRLEGVDASGRLIPGCVGVTELVLDEEDEEAAPASTSGELTPALVQLIGHLVETNAKVMQAMASAFGQVHPVAPTIVAHEPAKAEPEKPFDPAQIMQLAQNVMGMYSMMKKPDAVGGGGVQ